MKKIRAGFISYLNAYPYYFPFEQGHFSFEGECILDYPTSLNKKLSCGKLDISLISSMEYARNFEDYFLIDGVGLSSRGSVNSVKLCSRFVIEELSNKTIALTKASATSRAVLKIILAEKQCKDIQYVEFADEKSLEKYDAYLVIGDDALSLKQKPFYFEYDLAKIWQDIYSIDILFAVVAIRHDSLAKKHEELTNFSKLLCGAPSFSLQHLDFFKSCYERFKLPISIEDYFTQLDFSQSNKIAQREFLFQKFYHFNLIPKEVVS